MISRGASTSRACIRFSTRWPCWLRSRVATTWPPASAPARKRPMSATARCSGVRPANGSAQACSKSWTGNSAPAGARDPRTGLRFRAKRRPARWRWARSVRGARRSRNHSVFPQAPARDPGALGERAELEIDDVRVHGAESAKRAETAIGAGDDAFATDDIRETQDALGDELGVLHVVGRRAEHAGHEDLVVRHLLPPENGPLVRVARIRGLEQQRLQLRLDHDG